MKAATSRLAVFRTLRRRWCWGCWHTRCLTPARTPHRFVRLAVYNLACMALGLVLSISGLCPIVEAAVDPKLRSLQRRAVPSHPYGVCTTGRHHFPDAGRSRCASSERTHCWPYLMAELLSGSDRAVSPRPSRFSICFTDVVAVSAVRGRRRHDAAEWILTIRALPPAAVSEALIHAVVITRHADDKRATRSRSSPTLRGGDPLLQLSARPRSS